MTYNGTVINKPSDKVNTQINLAIMKKYDEEEEQFDYQKEIKKANKDTKYLRSLNLAGKIKKEIDIRNFIKINTGVSYIPCIYTDQNTKFRINFGASAFRNRQPEFQAGLLYNLDEEFDQLLSDHLNLNEEQSAKAYSQKS